MWKTVVVGATALMLTASTLAYAQGPSREAERLSEADIAHLTDARVNVVKAALQLTADQDKLWPPVEEAIRARGKDRETRAHIARQGLRKRGRGRIVDKLRTSTRDAIRRRHEAI